MSGDLPDFPVDDATLLAVDHAIGGMLSVDAEHGGTLDEPVRVGADYGLADLLDFLAGVTGPDPERCYRIDGDGERMTPEQIARDDALGVDQVWLDERPHYCEHDVIRALIAEVRHLRRGIREVADEVDADPMDAAVPLVASVRRECARRFRSVVED